MSRSRESRPRGPRKQQTKITYAARARTLNRLKKLSWDTGIRSLSSFCLAYNYTLCIVHSYSVANTIQYFGSNFVHRVQRRCVCCKNLKNPSKTSEKNGLF